MVNTFLRWIEPVLSFVIRKLFRIQLKGDSLENFIQFVKFGIVGITNCAISYVSYLLFIHIGLHYTHANIIGFTISVFNSYFWNNKYVFRTDSQRTWWRTFIKTYISYAATGIVLSNVLLYLWINILEISVVIAPLINLVITVPINFLVNKFWAYRK